MWNVLVKTHYENSLFNSLKYRYQTRGPGTGPARESEDNMGYIETMGRRFLWEMVEYEIVGAARNVAGGVYVESIDGRREIWPAAKVNKLLRAYEISY